MEFHVELGSTAPAPDRLEEQLLDLDPMAVYSINGISRTLEVSTMLDSTELIRVLRAAGCDITPAQVRELPAFCCGECST